MKKNLLACLSLITLLFLSQFSLANTELKGKYSGFQVQPTAGKAISLKKSGLYATEILVINNTPDAITIEVPYTGVYDWLNGNRVYRITSNILFPTTNVRIWHPDYGYIDSYVSNFSIVSFSIQYGRANVITVEYH